jgi:hypothetical protein
MDPKILIGFASLVIGAVSYAFYIRKIVSGKVKPDAASWFIWGVLAAITFFAQDITGAGAGAWITGFTALICLCISCLAFFKEGMRLTLIDSLSLFGAFIAILLWAVTKDPLVAVVLVILAGALGFVPTFIKAYQRPKEETLVTFGLNALKFVVALFALQTIAPATWLYPAAMAAMNTSLAGILFIRGR